MSKNHIFRESQKSDVFVFRIMFIIRRKMTTKNRLKDEANKLSAKY